MDSIFLEENLPNPLTKEEIGECFHKYYNGDLEARKTIIEHNIRLVISRVLTKFPNTSIPKEDLVSIGLIGLLNSIEKYELDKNVAFSTYAIKAIDNEITSYLIQESKRINPISLETPISNSLDSDMTLKDTLEDDSIDMDETIEAKEDYKMLRDIIATLPEKEQQVVQMVYGIGYSKNYKETEIAKKLNVSKTYINHLLTKGLRKIRANIIMSEKITDAKLLKKKM